MVVFCVSCLYFLFYLIISMKNNPTRQTEKSPETTCFLTCLVQKSKQDNTRQPDKHTFPRHPHNRYFLFATSFP